MNHISKLAIILMFIFVASCSKKDNKPAQKVFRMDSHSLDGKTNTSFTYSLVSLSPKLVLNFSDRIDESSISKAVYLTRTAGSALQYDYSLENDNTTLVVSPASRLQGLTAYSFIVYDDLVSQAGNKLSQGVIVSFSTGIDSTDKFEVVGDEELLTLVQRQTFKYFWDFGHPVSGLARERNTSGDQVTSGGSGFGIMAIVAGISREFITRQEGLARMKTIVSFLKNTAQTFHGAYPHWLNGATGAAMPFSQYDDGADLVETSYLMQGLITARQFFNGGDPDETTLRDDINTIWNRVEWDWFRNNSRNVLYWHWSPNYEWQMNFPIKGWNECLITYVMAASSTTHTIPKTVYDEGWAQNGAIQNGNSYYGVLLPMGPANGGPLFFAHYSFLGLNPTGLSDQYANYWAQNVAHTKINYNYCVTNPKEFTGYSDAMWGLTASDNQNGYSAHSPDNDLGVITPTAAISSMPYTPEESMRALKFFYYKLGDRLWKEYGFVDAFSLNDAWYADSFLAIDQGPIIIMIENYRSGLLWDLFMSAPEVKDGLTKLGFSGPNL
ncbi:MAG: Ig-like domain-containing protein [Chitinophagaceae bacterium]|nr:Ig-like domain-containing protein [Chitinophagaceae bacterium]